MKMLIAIDDTDNADSMGTGRLSRLLAGELQERRLIGDFNVTRHQLLVHPDIPYTSHNSASCISAPAKADMADVFVAARDFMNRHMHHGANPGLCIAPADAVPPALPALGIRAQKEVIPLPEGYDLAVSPGTLTWRAGLSGQGVIGAMSAVGLRSTGDDGRFIGLPGIRGISGVVTVGELLAATGVEAVADMEGRELAAGEQVDTRSWVRPSLRGGRIVYLVAKDGNVWVPALKRKRDEDDGQNGQ